ncbi:MAG: dTMP kinase [Ureaplasma sp.]|nr:dTMP kinase [Ureaplasma sp.]MDE7222112.1 dTMP kinase [Ureaplasma sp.]
MKHSGLFVSFEGCEGSGKSTIATLLYEEINKLIINKEINYSKVIKTREPGGINNKLAEKLRELVLSNDFEIPPLTEAFLFASARSAHVIQTIKPVLDNNGIVLCDRFVDSSIVYQQYVKKIGENVTTINKIATGGLEPDIIFYLKIDPEIGLNRINSNNRETNRFDQQDISFHNAVSNFYNLHLTGKPNVVIINAELSEKEIVNICLSHILNFNK